MELMNPFNESQFSEIEKNSEKAHFYKLFF